MILFYGATLLGKLSKNTKATTSIGIQTLGPVDQAVTTENATSTGRNLYKEELKYDVPLLDLT